MLSLLLAAGALLSTPLPSSPDRPTVIVAVGAEGDADYGKRFAQWAQRWEDAAERGNANFIAVGQDSPQFHGADLEASPSAERAGDETDKAQLKTAIEAELEPERAHQPLWIVLIGHGTFDGKQAKFNLRGPDVSDEELAEWLERCKRPLAVINCSSASAPFLTRLSGPGRVIVTATRTGNENNVARFGDYLSSAIAAGGADLDKDGQVSLLEAFLAASHRTAEFYKHEGRIQTEHALLDDNGDKLGISADFFAGLRATKGAADGAAIDGPRARQYHLVLSPAEQAMPAERRAQRDQLEQAIEKLRQQKESLDESDYYSRLEPLLLELARIYATPSSPTSAPVKPPARPAAAP
ncbi:MAG TPA: hypothetical protein VGR35_02545 [Tepidisphaeraceae bacterium]|nr:hypothetical protein [Tepidisphaeraceae bacterium]